MHKEHITSFQQIRTLKNLDLFTVEYQTEHKANKAKAKGKMEAF